MYMVLSTSWLSFFILAFSRICLLYILYVHLYSMLNSIQSQHSEHPPSAAYVKSVQPSLYNIPCHSFKLTLWDEKKRSTHQQQQHIKNSFIIVLSFCPKLRIGRLTCFIWQTKYTLHSRQLFIIFGFTNPLAVHSRYCKEWLKVASEWICHW